MSKYLNGDGLSHLMTNIKNEIAATVTGVKGNAESSYRTGQVNITAANVGALGASDNAVSATKLKTARTINVGNMAAGTATSFDGSANITIPVNTFNTSGLIEPSIVKGGTKTSLPLVGTLKGNKLALLPADQIIIEKTTDGGATWVDAGVSDSAKRSLFSGNMNGGNIGIPLKDGVRSADCGIRITITAMKYNVPDGTAETGKYAYWNSSYVTSTERYGSMTSLYFWVNTINDGLSCKCEYAAGSSSLYTNWITVFNKDTTEALQGWSGGDYIAFSNTLFGGGTTQTGNAWNWRFTFFTRNSTGGTTLATTYNTQVQSVGRICGYGPNIWTSPNNLAAMDHLYSWDLDKTAVFPASIRPSVNNSGYLGTSSFKWAGVYASAFNGPLTGNVTGNCSGTAANVTGTVAIANGGTGATTAAAAWTALGGGAIGKKASLAASDIPAHASTATTYGAGSSTNYGHLKLSDSTASTSGTSGGTAATPSAVKAAYDKAAEAMSAATGGLYYDIGYTVSNGVVTGVPRVYSAGAEVTSNYAKECFSWFYKTGTGGSWVQVATNNDRSCQVLLTVLGNWGTLKCDFTPA